MIPRDRPLRQQKMLGFSMIETIMAIVITAILFGIVALFIARPVTGYIDSVRRAELTNAADLALRRLTRDVRTALPNSLRLSGTASGDCIEFIATSTGGRYRDATVDGSTGGNSLNFLSTAATTFDILGISLTQSSIVVGDYVVVNNLSGASAYDPAANNRQRISGVAAGTSTITLTLADNTNVFAAQSPARPSLNSQLHVVPDTQEAVSYRCIGGQLRRYSNYGFNTAQVCPPGGTDNLVVGDNAVCTFSKSDTFGLLNLNLTLSDTTTGEATTLFQQIHMDNVP